MFKIYRIISPSTAQQYIGSTSRPLRQRFYQHTTAYHMGKFISSAEVVQHLDAKIELIEMCDQASVKEREAHYITCSPNCCNIRVPGRTIETPYPCYICTKCVSSRNMARHRREIHADTTIRPRRTTSRDLP